MTLNSIKLALLEGQNFGNESANWYTLCKPCDNRFLIVIGERYLSYKNINSATKRIWQLINKGY